MLFGAVPSSSVGSRYLWSSKKLQEMRAEGPRATWEEASGVLARQPVQRSHRRVDNNGRSPSLAAVAATRS